MKKYLLAILVIIGLTGGLYVVGLKKTTRSFKQVPVSAKITQAIKDEPINKAFQLIRVRKDRDALVIFELILIDQPEYLDALWGKAEVLRRSHKYKEAEVILDRILKKNPKHTSSLISLAYIRYRDDKLNEASRLVRQALKSSCQDKENQALVYMMLGAINSRRSAKGGLLSKVRFGTQIKCHFLKAKELSPDSPEAHLGLGTFYLLAPAIVGGNLHKAIEELEVAVKIAPDFATANARLAQAYKKKGDLKKFDFYIQHAKELDPQNEALKEIRDGSQAEAKVSP